MAFPVFYNITLENIHLSYRSMQQEVNHMISILTYFLFNNPFQLSPILERSNLMEEPREIVVPEAETEYVHPISFNSFGDLENPVVDSEGYFREKNDPYIERGIYTGKPVTIIESSDLKKIQTDHKTLTNSVDEMKRLFSIMMLENAEQRRENAELRRENAEIRKENAAQRKMIEDQAKCIAAINLKMEEQNKTIEDLKVTVISQRNQINNLQEIIEQKDKRIEMLESENRKFKEKVEGFMSDSEEKFTASSRESLQFIPKNSHILPPTARGKKWNPIGGFVDTMSVFTPDSILTQRKQENALRKEAHEGNYVALQNRLNRNKEDIINGRGMPDALCSTVRGFKDKTALMLAAQAGHIKCVNLLIENEAHLNFLDRDNLTALDYAQQNFHKETTDLLKKHGALNGVDISKRLESTRHFQKTWNENTETIYQLR